MSYDLHDNVAVDIIEYSRGVTIRNEEQFLLLMWSYLSGLMDDTHDYNNSVCIGTSSSGKTHLKDKADTLCDKLDVMDASTGTDKSLIHDDEWDTADIISMGELQQPNEEMLEFMKRADGGDEEVVIRQTRGNPQEGFETVPIRKPAKCYHFTYAQFDADFEFWNRLLKIPVHESESKNRAVGRLEAGHENITIGDEDVEYGYPVEDVKAALQNHMLAVKQNAPKRVDLPNNQDEHDWGCWEVLEPIFNHGRSEVNRVYKMVFNLVKASTLMNFKHRDRTTVTEDGDDYEALVAEPQDVANVVRCLRVLRATTHEIDRKKRAIVEGIRAKSGPDDAIEGLGPIREFLKESDAAEVKQGEMENILEDLQENFLIHIIEDAGEGGRDVYRAYNWDKLGRPMVDENAELFEDAVDPIDNEPFLDSWQDLRENLETTAQDLLKSATIDDDDRVGSSASSSSNGDSGGSGGGLASYGGGVQDDDDDIELNPWTETILDEIKPVIDGSRIENLEAVPPESFLGLTGFSNPDLSAVDHDGTMLDPDHEIWEQDEKPDSWIESETQARNAVEMAIDELIEKSVIDFEEIHDQQNGSPIDATLTVNDI